MPDEREEELVRWAQHDPAAFGLLYDRYVERIYAFACRMTGDPSTAQDITAAVFEKALTHLDRFEWRGIYFGAWLYRLARNETARLYRKERWLAPLSEHHPTGIDVEATVIEGLRGQDLRRAFARLERGDQELLILRFIEDLSSGEVAQALNLKPAVLYLRLHRALQRLRRQVEAVQTEDEQKGAENYVEP
jgi:RNA polymerase sigma-70 factor (ECF subfamily)